MLTKQQKRATRKEFGLVRALDQSKNQTSAGNLSVKSQELEELQKSDSTLEHATQLPGFFRRDGLMFQQWVPQGLKEEDGIDQIILPRECRKTVLTLAHTIPLGGHLVKNKTAERIMRRFYWPTLFHDVEDYCKSCAECQKSGHHCVRRAPIVPLPVTEEPFERIAMDVVGPLPRSHTGHRYVLVVCDYATRHVAEELVYIFSRVGIPKEILTEQDTNFTSELLAEMYRLLHIDGLRISPYHPQTDGMVERFNGALKEMLRKCATEDGKDWDRLLPNVLFVVFSSESVCVN